MSPLIIDFVFLPLIGGLHGWITNIIAIRLLFHPRKPVRVGPFTLQGVLPKRRVDLAAKIGQAIEEQLLSAEDLLAALHTDDLEAHIEAAVLGEVRGRLDGFLPRLLPFGMKQTLIGFLESALMREIMPAVRTLMDSAQDELLRRAKVADMIERKILAFDLSELEALVYAVAGHEMRYIEYLGLFMGLFIGTVQGLFLLFVGGAG